MVIFFFFCYTLFFSIPVYIFSNITKQMPKSFSRFFFFLILAFFLSNISMNKIQNIDSKISNIVSLKYYINNNNKKKLIMHYFFFSFYFFFPYLLCKNDRGTYGYP